jgi:hypothetical protein
LAPISAPISAPFSGSETEKRGYDFRMGGASIESAELRAERKALIDICSTCLEALEPENERFDLVVAIRSIYDRASDFPSPDEDADPDDPGNDSNN